MAAVGQVVEHGSLEALQSEVDEAHLKQDARDTEFSTKLMKELEGASKKVDNILEEECCDLFSVVVTCVFSHLILHDLLLEFEGVMGPVPEESHSDLATTMEDHVRTLLDKFLCDADEESDKEPHALL
ncbi:hypothetical protein D1007_26471 [Hordeum vulgare]|nr:hypothetical protein D1007_26471 [Hordeum vulgare]